MSFLPCAGPLSPSRVARIYARAITAIRWPLAILFAVVLPLGGSFAYAEPIPFVFQYTDAPGVGFNDPVNGPQRKAALEFAGNILGNLLDRSYATETINVSVQFTPLSNSLIGQAGPATYHINQSNLLLDTYYGGALANHLVGMDLDSANPEISARFDINSIGQFYFGTDSMNPANSYDFVQLAMHELVHGLSFVHNFEADGTLDGSQPVIYSRFVQVGQGMGAMPILNLSAQDRATALVGGSLYWSGPAGKLASGANEPQLHAPAMFLPASSVSHLSEAVYTTSLMTPGLGTGPTEASHVVSAIERGMLRDMGWHIPVGGILWTGGGGNDVWSNPANWQNGVVPQSRDTLTFGPTAQTQVNAHYGFENPLLAQSNSTFESINFAADAPSYLLLFNYTTETTIDGAGVLNNSANVQTIKLKNLGPTYFTDVFGPAAKLLFRETATAGNANVHYEVENGFIFYTEDETGITRLGPAEIGFYDSATAGGANFLLKGGGGDGSFGGIVRFYDNSTAANATFTVEHGKPGIGLPAVSIGYGFGGELLFYNFSSASTATVENLGQTNSQGHAGFTEFFDFSAADHAVLNNRAATMPGVASGFTFFTENSTASDATILNEASISSESGKTGFYGFSTAAHATITNQGPMANFHVGGRTIFYDNAIAGNAEIINQGNGPGIAGSLGGRTEFRNDSSADHATVRLLPGVGSPGAALFYDRATGGNANIQIETSNGGSGGLVEFYDQSTAGNALITIAAQSLNASLKFYDNASAGDSTIILANSALGAVDFHGSSSGGMALISVGFQNYLNFRETSTAGDAEIVIASGAYGQFIGLNNPGSTPTTTAGTADITLQSGGIGGSLNFSAFSTAGDANIVNEGGTQPGTKGGDLAFNAGSRAGNATIITQGGTGGGLYAYTRFTSGALGENVKLITTGGGIVDFSGNRYFGGTSVGLIEGAGTYILDHAHLTVGGINQDMIVDGQVIDYNPQAGPGGTLTKVGNGTLQLNGINTYAGLTTVSAGRLLVNGSLTGGALVQSGAILGGHGTIAGPVVVETGGVHSPGNSPGTITVGSLTLQNDSQTFYELGTVSDLTVVNGILQLDGSLILSFAAGFLPTMGQSFTLFSGTFGTPIGQFDEVILPQGIAMSYDVNYAGGLISLSAISNAILAGDYNVDGVVDAADYTIWRDTQGITGVPAYSGADGNGDGTITMADYNVWRSNFGQSINSQSASNLLNGVPEPTTYVLLIMSLMAFRYLAHTN